MNEDSLSSSLASRAFPLRRLSPFVMARSRWLLLVVMFVERRPAGFGGGGGGGGRSADPGCSFRFKMARQLKSLFAGGRAIASKPLTRSLVVLQGKQRVLRVHFNDRWTQRHLSLFGETERFLSRWPFCGFRPFVE